MFRVAALGLKGLGLGVAGPESLDIFRLLVYVLYLQVQGEYNLDIIIVATELQPY